MVWVVLVLVVLVGWIIILHVRIRELEHHVGVVSRKTDDQLSGLVTYQETMQKHTAAASESLAARVDYLESRLRHAEYRQGRTVVE